MNKLPGTNAEAPADAASGLRPLVELGEMDAGELARTVAIRMPSISRILKSLEKMTWQPKLVQRKTNVLWMSKSRLAARNYSKGRLRIRSSFIATSRKLWVGQFIAN